MENNWTICINIAVATCGCVSRYQREPENATFQWEFFRKEVEKETSKTTISFNSPVFICCRRFCSCPQHTNDIRLPSWEHRLFFAFYYGLMWKFSQKLRHSHDSLAPYVRAHVTMLDDGYDNGSNLLHWEHQTRCKQLIERLVARRLCPLQSLWKERPRWGFSQWKPNWRAPVRIPPFIMKLQLLATLGGANSY